MLADRPASLHWVLASASPRRKLLLETFGHPFEVVAADLDEEGLSTTDPFETAKLLAIAKARHVAGQWPNSLIIGGDTVVAMDGFIFGKPADAEDAARILRKLSGRTHQVLTGVALVWPDMDGVQATLAEVEVAQVTFRNLDDQEIERYAQSGEPLDKAGAYAIQGGAAEFVTQLEGNLDCVVGFPTETFKRLISQV